MIITTINGVNRQVFQFDGGKFYAPVSIGAGHRRKLELIKAKSIVSSDAWRAVVTRIATDNKKPHGMPDDLWSKKITEEAMDSLVGSVDIMDSVQADLAVLEYLLTPAEGSPDVKTWYDELSQESEVQQVLNFSEGRAESKISDDTPAPLSGEEPEPQSPDAP